jgi:hypothetical protein
MPNDLPPTTPTPPIQSAGAKAFEERLAVFIGPRWESSYQHKLRPFLEDASFVPSWNWPAALATLMVPVWFVYRKMYWWFLVFAVFPGLVLGWLLPDIAALGPRELLEPENEQALLVFLGVKLSTMLAAGGVANWLLFRRASTAIRLVSMQPIPGTDDMQVLRRVGGVSRGMTAVILVLALMLALQSAAVG